MRSKWELETVFADDVLYLEWKATGGGRKVEDGIDTFVFQDCTLESPRDPRLT